MRQEPLFAPSVKYSASIEYADQTDEIIHEALRRAMSGTPGPAYIEYPSHVILSELDVPDPLPPHRYRLVNQTAGEREVAEAVRLIRAAESPILLVGHGVHTSRTGAAVRELAELMACPVIQTSGGTSFIDGLQDRTFAYGFSPAAVEAVVTSDLCLALGTELGEPSHYGRTRHWAQNDATRKWILVEQDPAAIGVNRPIDVPLVGDLRGCCRSWWRRCGTPRESPRRIWTAGSSRTRRSWRSSPRTRRRAAPRSTRPGSSSRPPGPFPTTASWCATAAPPSSSAGPTRRPSRATSSGTRTSATWAPACRMRSGRPSPRAASGR